jgi:hypothetical protein
MGRFTGEISEGEKAFFARGVKRNGIVLTVSRAGFGVGGRISAGGLVILPCSLSR